MMDVIHIGLSAQTSLHSDLSLLCRDFFPEGKATIAVCGAGGKTSFLLNISDVLLGKKKKVLLTTTTHMQAFREHMVLGAASDIMEAFQKEDFIISGLLESFEPDNNDDRTARHHRIKYPGDLWLNQAGQAADYVLVEADGAKCLPLKYPDLTREPLIPPRCELCFLILGLSALGRTLTDCCLRLPLLEQAMGLAPGHLKNTAAEAEHYVMILQAYMEYFARQHPHISLIPVLNQADDKEKIQQAEEIYAALEQHLAEEKKHTAQAEMKGIIMSMLGYEAERRKLYV